MDTKKLIIICIAIIAIVAIGTFTFLNLNQQNHSEISYVNEDFDGFSMNVPNGTHFKKVNLEDYGQVGYFSDGQDYYKIVAYKNKGNYSENFSGILMIDTSLQFSLDNLTQETGEEDDSEKDPLSEYIFEIGDKVENEDRQTYMNTSNILIRGKNTTSGRYYQGTYLDNEHCVIVMTGNNLDFIKNATQSIKINR